MLVVDDVGDHHVADIGVQCRRLAEDVHAAQRSRGLGHLAEDVVRGQPQRIVDVDDHRRAAAQRAGVDVLQPGIEARRIEAVQGDHLGGDVEGATAADVEHSDRTFGGTTLGMLTGVVGEVAVVDPCGVVQEVGPLSLRVSGAEALQLLTELLGTVVLDEGD